MAKPTCTGCRSDIYNGNNNHGIKECWHKKTAKPATRYRIHRDTLPASPGAFTKVKVFACYYAPPWSYYHGLPDFVKPEDVRIDDA